MSTTVSAAEADLAYPRGCEVDVALRDGSTIHVRPVTAEDRPGIEEFLRKLSPRSIAFRFFGQVDLGWAADWSTDVDYADCYALLATTGHDQEVIAHGAYVRTGPQSAEVSFAVADKWQGDGIATVMLAHLAAAAEARGITLFTVEVLPANHRMIGVFRGSGYAVDLHSVDGAVHVEFPTSRSWRTGERFEQREQTAAIAAVRCFLEPESVAVIGASAREGTVGGAILGNIRNYGFTGRLYAINRRVREIGGERAYSSIADVPEPVDLAVIVVPAEQVVRVAQECASAGARALLVISAGFTEVGEEGGDRQLALLRTCREAGMRLMGPTAWAF